MQEPLLPVPMSMFGHGLRFSTYTALHIPFGFRPGDGATTLHGIVHGDRLLGQFMILTGHLTVLTIHCATGTA